MVSNVGVSGCRVGMPDVSLFAEKYGRMIRLNCIEYVGKDDNGGLWKEWSEANFGGNMTYYSRRSGYSS